VKHAIDVGPFDELADPRVLAELAAAAEERGWDGFFVWDHIVHRPPVQAVADPWIALAAMAAATSRIRIGPMVTPVSRRRVHKLARETVTLDLLSDGRLIFGAGLGYDVSREFTPFGEVDDARERARLLDAGLEGLARYWAGEFQPAPVQQPRIPVWVAGQWPNRRPARRAARWDGYVPISVPDPDAMAELVTQIRAARPAGADEGFDVIAYLPPGEDTRPWARAGATWTLTDVGSHPGLARVREVITAGPPAGI
jgi:alkanesulfonate monooxygenase SsuD/methylene tetrahydromethanopterin reductase-like flavin-dependent oxidoreductase (luciferase family)